MTHPMIALIDQYLAGIPVERDVVQAKEVRDLLLDIRLTFMVQGDDPAPAFGAPQPRVFLWKPTEHGGYYHSPPDGDGPL